MRGIERWMFLVWSVIFCLTALLRAFGGILLEAFCVGAGSASDIPKHVCMIFIKDHFKFAWYECPLYMQGYRYACDSFHLVATLCCKTIARLSSVIV